MNSGSFHEIVWQTIMKTAMKTTIKTVMKTTTYLVSLPTALCKRSGPSE